MKISVNGKEFEAYATSLTGKSFNKDRNDVKLELTTSDKSVCLSDFFDNIKTIIVNEQTVSFLFQCSENIECSVCECSQNDFKGFITVLQCYKFDDEYFCDVYRNEI